MCPVPLQRGDLRGGVFSGSAMVAAGRITRGQLRGSAWQRLFRDVYACASLTVTHEIRAVAAAHLVVPRSVVAGRSAAVLWGIDAAGPADDVELDVPPGSPACTVPGIRVRRRRLADDEWRHRGRTPTTTPTVTAVDVGRWVEPIEESVALVDALVRTGRTRLAWVRDAASAAGGPGCRRARRVAALADGLAESPQETRLRLVLHAARLPRPVAQHDVRDANGGFVARVDFGWPEQRVAAEYEGAWHGRAQNVHKDRARLNRLTAAGWKVVFVTAADLRDPVALVARVGAALAG